MNHQPTEPATPATTTSKNIEQRYSRTGNLWIALGTFSLLLLLLLVFILQNNKPIEITYFGWNGTLSFGVAMLLSAVTGILLTLLIGSVRILQLKLNRK